MIKNIVARKINCPALNYALARVWTKDTIQLNRERDSLNALNKTDSLKTFTKVEIESEFPGGASVNVEVQKR
jgi:hypothetical protein